MPINLTEIIFRNLVKKLFVKLSQNVDIWGHFGPKMTEFWTFSQKMTDFDQIDPINDIFDPISVHKPN